MENERKETVKTRNYKIFFVCLALCAFGLVAFAAELSNGERLNTRNLTQKQAADAAAISIVQGRTSTWETASTDASVLKGRTQTWENAAATVSGGSYGMVLVFGSNVTFNGAGGYILVTNLPTSAAGLAPGRLWLGNFAAGAAVTNALCVAP